MRYLNETDFEQANVFGKGEANVNFAQYFIGESFLNPLTDPGQCPLMISGMPQQLAYPSRCQGRRTDPLVYGRRGLVPGRRKGSDQLGAGQRHLYSGGCEALAWGKERFLVQPYCI